MLTKDGLVLRLTLAGVKSGCTASPPGRFSFNFDGLRRNALVISQVSWSRYSGCFCCSGKCGYRFLRRAGRLPVRLLQQLEAFLCITPELLRPKGTEGVPLAVACSTLLRSQLLWKLALASYEAY